MELSNAFTEPASRPQSFDTRISVITAWGNSTRHLFDTLDSVRRQTHGRTEHIVINIADNDRRVSSSEPQVQGLSLIKGQSASSKIEAWNQGIASASGEVLVFLDAGNVFDGPDVLTRVAQSFEDPWLSAVYGNVKHVRQDNPCLVVRHQRPGRFNKDQLRWGWAPACGALFVRRHWYQRINGFSTRLTRAADYDAALRLFSHKFFKAEYLDQALVCERLQPWRLQDLGQALQRPREELQVLRQARLGGLPTVLWKNIRQLGLYL